MTAQISDTVIFQDESYRIAGIKGDGLPTPADFGMTPTMMSTACYRGYYVEYLCQNNQFLLDAMTIRTANDVYPAINGLNATIGGTFRAGQYAGLNMPTGFSGGILIAKDFIGSMYVHMGFQKPTSFETVIELLIEQGNITSTIDHSAYIARLRADLLKPRPRPGFDDPTLQRQHLENWITWTFSLNYDL